MEQSEQLWKRIDYLEMVCDQKDETIEKATSIIESLKKELINLQNEVWQQKTQDKRSSFLSIYDESKRSSKEQIEISSLKRNSQDTNKENKLLNQEKLLKIKFAFAQRQQMYDKPNEEFHELIGIQYIKFNLNEIRWENFIQTICAHFQKILNNFTSNINKTEIMDQYQASQIQWSEKCDQLQNQLLLATNQIEQQSSLLHDMQYQYQYLLNQQKKMVQDFKQLIEKQNQISNESSVAIQLLNEFANFDLKESLQFAKQVNNQILLDLNNVIQIKNNTISQEQKVTKQSNLKNEYERVQKVDQMTNLTNSYNLIKGKYEELILGILNLSNSNGQFQRNVTSTEIINRHRDALYLIEGMNSAQIRVAELSDELEQGKQKCRLRDLSIGEEKQQNDIMYGQIKQLEQQLNNLSQENEKLQIQSRDNIELQIEHREKLLQFQQTNQQMKLEKMDNDKQIENQFIQLKNEYHEIINNYEASLQALQQEYDILCEESRLREYEYSTQHQVQLDESIQKIEFLSRLIDDQNRIIEKHQNKNFQFGPSQRDLLLIIKKLINQIDEAIRSHLQFINDDSQISGLTLNQITQSEELIKSLTILFNYIENN